jgi:hypothetical protein
MPTISGFYGILIRMFFNHHAPPHFHARYAEFEATIDITNSSKSYKEIFPPAQTRLTPSNLLS